MTYEITTKNSNHCYNVTDPSLKFAEKKGDIHQQLTQVSVKDTLQVFTSSNIYTILTKWNSEFIIQK